MHCSSLLWILIRPSSCIRNDQNSPISGYYPINQYYEPILSTFIMSPSTNPINLEVAPKKIASDHYSSGFLPYLTNLPILFGDLKFFSTNPPWIHISPCQAATSLIRCSWRCRWPLHRRPQSSLHPMGIPHEHHWYPLVISKWLPEINL